MARWMIVVGVREAKGRMAWLIERARTGEDVVITRRGERVARLEAISDEAKLPPRSE